MLLIRTKQHIHARVCNCGRNTIKGGGSQFLECHTVCVWSQHPLSVQATPSWAKARWWKVSASTWGLAMALSITAMSTTLCAWERAGPRNTTTPHPQPATKRWRSTSQKSGGEGSCWPCDCEWTWFALLGSCKWDWCECEWKGEGRETWVFCDSMFTERRFHKQMTGLVCYRWIIWW